MGDSWCAALRTPYFVHSLHSTVTVCWPALTVLSLPGLFIEMSAFSALLAQPGLLNSEGSAGRSNESLLVAIWAGARGSPLLGRDPAGYLTPQWVGQSQTGTVYFALNFSNVGKAGVFG